MKIGEFTRYSSAVLADAVATGQPKHITNRSADYATVVATARFNQMAAAEDIVQGLLRLARRGAECSEYQAYAEALEDMAHFGHLDIKHPDGEQQVA